MYNSFINSTIDDCLIEGNSASSGGGIFNDGGFAPVITHSIIKDNYASANGGGICNDEKNDAVITSCKILLNTASSRGGGIYSGMDGSSDTNYAEVQLTNNVIANNWATLGGGLYNAGRSSAKIINCTIAGNKAATSGAGLYVYTLYSYASVMNSILYGNVLDGGGNADVYFQPAYITGSADANLRLLYNNFSVLIESWHNSGAPSRTGNIGVLAGFANYNGPDGDPLAGGDSDYHLVDSSAVIDKGIATYSTYSLVAPSSDIEDVPRPQGTAHDLGAYEVIISTYSLTMASNPVAGGTTVPATGTSQILPATPENISASPASGYTFVNWTTSGGLAVVSDPNAASTTVTLTGSATVTANFCLNQIWYLDGDNDSYGTPGSTLVQCTQPAGYVTDSTDCNDGDNTINPGATEVADDGIDQNCNGSDTITCFVDSDHDSYGTSAGTTVLADDGTCDTAQGESTTNNDCNDSNPSIHPGATEIADDGIDQDCNGSDTITCVVDNDHDGYGTSAATTVLADDGTCDTAQGESTTSDDCNDTNSSIHPGAVEVCDSVDNNCDGSIDEGVTSTWYLDNDGDTYGDTGTTTEACTQPSGYVSDNTDCDDSDALEHPNQIWYKDEDGDGYSDGTKNTTSCERPENYYVASELKRTSGDPDDTDPNIIPSSPWALFLPAILGHQKK